MSQPEREERLWVCMGSGEARDRLRRPREAARGVTQAGQGLMKGG